MNDLHPVVDENVIHQLLELADEGEDAQLFLNELIDIFFDKSASVVSELTAAVNGQNARVAANLAHKLKGFAANLGLKRLAALCNELERKGAVDHITPMDKALADDLVAAYNAAKAELARRRQRSS